MTKNPSSAEPVVDADGLRDQVKLKYRDVATNPEKEFHFHTGRALSRRLKYDEAITSRIPDHAVESLAGVANPFSLRDLQLGEKVVDLGCGAGFDCFVASGLVGDEGEVVGVEVVGDTDGGMVGSEGVGDVDGKTEGTDGSKSSARPTATQLAPMWSARSTAIQLGSKWSARSAATQSVRRLLAKLTVTQ